MANPSQQAALRRWWRIPANRMRQSEIRRRNALKNRKLHSDRMKALWADEGFRASHSIRSRATMIRNWKNKSWRDKLRKSGIKVMRSRVNKRISAMNCILRNCERTPVTGLEFRLYLYLAIDKKRYVPQFRVSAARTVADAKVGNRLIYADGSYWHSFKRAKERHRFQARLARRLGYSCIRLREDSFDSDYEKKVYGSI
jgi:hypothetical protein